PGRADPDRILVTRVRRAVEPAVEPLDDEARLGEQLLPALDRHPGELELGLGAVAAHAEDERLRRLVPVGALEDPRLALDPAPVRRRDVVGAGCEDVEDEAAAVAQPRAHGTERGAAVVVGLHVEQRPERDHDERELLLDRRVAEVPELKLRLHAPPLPLLPPPPGPPPRPARPPRPPPRP